VETDKKETFRNNIKAASERCPYIYDIRPPAV